MNTSLIDGIIYSCYTQLNREGENFIPFHVFSYIESGSLRISDRKMTMYLLRATVHFMYVTALQGLLKCLLQTVQHLSRFL